MFKLRGLRGLSLLDVMEQGKPTTYVIFCNTEQPRWYNKYLKDGFRHCSILHFDGFNWYRLEHNWSGVEMRHITCLDGFQFYPEQNISRYYEQQRGYTILEFDSSLQKELNGSKRRSKFLMTPNTCVEFVKDWCGIRRYWVHTPYQLYKLIRGKNG